MSRCSECGAEREDGEAAVRVRIDGVETVLTYDSFSGARGHQYLTPGNASSHAFGSRLVRGTAFRTNGHRYEVL